MTDKQPEALRLADALDEVYGWHNYMTDDQYKQAAAELRRLHAENLLLHERHAGDNQILRSIETQRDELLEALKEVSEVFDVSWRNGSTQRRLGDLARAAIAKATGETK